jgi:hypothetical protein
VTAEQQCAGLGVVDDGSLGNGGKIQTDGKNRDDK